MKTRVNRGFGSGHRTADSAFSGGAKRGSERRDTGIVKTCDSLGTAVAADRAAEVTDDAAHVARIALAGETIFEADTSVGNGLCIK